MKRVKAACILQTLVFAQKEDCGLSRECQIAENRREAERYKQTLAHAGTRFQIVEEAVQANGSILIRVKKQYSGKIDVSEYFA